MVHAIIVAMADDAGGGGGVLHDPVAAGHGTAQGAANPDVRFAGGRLPKHRIERDQLENVNRLQLELHGDPAHAFVTDETEFLLPQMEQRHRGAAFPIRRITPDRFIHFPSKLGGDTLVRRFHGDDVLAYSDNVLAFDCTLSSLKTTVTDSFPWA